MRITIKLSFIFLFVFSITGSLYADDFYWVGGTGKWSDDTHWATESGGATSPDRVPNLKDNIFIDENSFTDDNQVIQIDILNAEVLNADFSKAVNPFSIEVIAGGRNLVVYGSFIANSNFNSGLSQLVFEEGNADIEIKTGGKKLANEVLIRSSKIVDLFTSNEPLSSDLQMNGNGTLKLNDSLKVSSSININNGRFITNSHSIITHQFNFSGSNTAIQLMNSNIKITYWSASNINTFSTGTSTIRISESWGGTFNGAGYTYYNVELCGRIVISGNNSYNELTFCEASDIELEPGSTQNTKTLVADGTPAKPIRIASRIFESTAYIKQASGTVEGTSLNLEDIHASGGAIFNAVNSVDLGNVQGWNITQPTPKKFYWVGGTGNWSDYGNHWATSSGGDQFHEALPNVYDEVIFDSNSFSTSSEVIIDLYHAYAGRMDWSGINRQVELRSYQISPGNPIDTKLHVFGSLIFNELASSSLRYIRFKSDQDEIVDSDKSYLAGVLDFYHTSEYSILAHSSLIAQTFFLNRDGTTIIEDSVLVGNDLHLNLGSLIVDSSYISCPYIRMAGTLVDITKSDVNVGTWEINGINEFRSDSSTINVSSAFWGGSLDYFDVIACGRVRFGGNNTYNKLEFCPGSDIYLPAEEMQTADTLAITGDPGFPVSIASNNEGVKAGIAQNGGTVDTKYMYLKDNEASGAVFTALESIDLDNVDGWNIVNPNSQTFYWVNGSGSWSEYDNHWAKTSGGIDFHDRIPGALDKVVFDLNSFISNNSNIQIDQIKTYTNDITFQEVNQDFGLNGGAEFWCFGSFLFSERGNAGLSYLLFPVDTGTHQVDSEGKFLANLIAFKNRGNYEIFTNDQRLASQVDVNGGTFNLNDDLILGSTFNIYNGNFSSNSNHIGVPNIFIGSEGGSVQADIASSFIEVSSWNVGEQVDFQNDTSTINVLDPYSNAYFNGGSHDYYKVNTACVVYFTGDNSYEKLTITYGAKVYIEGEQSVNELAAVGTSGNPIKITGGAFSKSAGKSVAQYLILTDNQSTGEGELIAERSIDDGGNHGWFISPPVANVDANTLDVLNGEPLCGQAIETTLSLPPGLLTSYKWFKDGVPLDYDSSSIVVSDEGIYHVELTNACGTVAKSNEIDISREPPPEIPSIDVDGETSLCGNQPIEVDLKTEEQPRVHYRWLKDGEIIGEDLPDIFIEEEGTYTLRLTKGECVVESTDSVVVVIKDDVPVVQDLVLQGQDTICLGDSTRLFVEYEKGTTYNWQSADTTFSTQANFVDIFQGGTYSVQLENGCGITDATGTHDILVKVKPAIQEILLEGPDLFCFYDSVKMSVPPEEEVLYEWFVNDDQPVKNMSENIAYSDTAGTYFLVMTNMCGSTTTDEIKINHLYLPGHRDILMQKDSVFCIGDSVILSLDFVNGETWSWINNDDTIASNIDRMVIQNPGLYSLNISNVCGTIEANNVIPVRVLPIPSETIVKDFYERCGPGELIVKVEGGEDGNYVWRDENGNIIYGLNDEEIIVPLVNSKDYFVTITNGYCEGPGNIVDMNVLEVPLADAGEDKEVTYGDKVKLGGQNDYPNTYYLWSPDIWINNEEAPDPVVSPEETTMYVLEAIGQNRCSTFDSVLVIVNFDLVIPNTFTPNNDGTNDLWQIRNIEFHPDSKLEIFNRWGTKLYEKTGYSNDWDGTYQGEKLPVDTYFYVIQKNDDTKPQKGSVTILR